MNRDWNRRYWTKRSPTRYTLPNTEVLIRRVSNYLRYREEHWIPDTERIHVRGYPSQCLPRIDPDALDIGGSWMSPFIDRRPA